ncbi:MAG TPA: aldehyde reductase [Vicinamibacterales bacterium]|nr:aldehyde reductase [Vicinamibacterales bacterium]
MKVLVTGGSGFVGSHVVLQLLNAGHDVRTTVRSLKRENDVRAVLTAAGADTGCLSFFAADLVRDDGWREAIAGCDFVIHVASPLPAAVPKSEDDVIVPARDGSLRVLKAARDAKVKRVVLTSSCGAVYYGYPPQDAPFDETSWTNLESREMSAYVKSKAIAERAAWDFIKTEGGGLELSVVNPAGILGPVLGADFSSSIEMIKRLMNGMPGCPQLHFGIVDVRDVADLHIRAMTHPAAKGERFIAVQGNAMSMLEIANVLRARLGAAARKVPTRELPNWIVRVAALFDPAMGSVLPMLGKVRHATGAKAERLLGWKPRPREEAIVACAESLIRFGV